MGNYVTAGSGVCDFMTVLAIRWFWVRDLDRLDATNKASGNLEDGEGAAGVRAA